MQDDDQKAIKAIIDEFFEKASPEDLLELQSLLEKRERKNSLGGVNVNEIASNFANDLRSRMGLTSEQITRSARDAVRTMILQYDPNIPEESINVLLDQWVPDEQKKRGKVPAHIMKTMISQFIAYARGELTAAQLTGFPDGWAKKYWTFFPEKVQRLIEAYVRNRIDKIFFWESIEEIVGK